MPAPTWRKQFRLHESTQRQLCRLAFVLFALLPVICVLAYSAIRLTPWYQQRQLVQWQQRISNNLGVDCRFRSIEFPSPDHFRAYDFLCLHPETGKEILKVGQVDAAMDRSGWTVNLLRSELNGQQLQSAIQVVHDWFLCRPQKSASLLKLNVPDLAVFDGLKTTQFQNVEIGLRPTETTTAAYIHFSIDGQRFADQAKLIVERHHAIELPTTYWRLESRDIAIPCNVVAARFPMLSALGNDASFRGAMAWAQNDKHDFARINGNFEAVDMRTLTMSIGSPIRGTARLSIANAEILDSKLRKVSGALAMSSSGQEQIDVAWLKRTGTALSLLGDQSIWESEEKTAMLHSLDVRFELDHEGLSLSGLRDPRQQDWPMIAMVVDNKMLACQPKRTEVHAVMAWLQASSPGYGLGDANETDELGRFLSRTLPWLATSEPEMRPEVATDSRTHTIR
jgi:hypothetical protein